MEFKPIDDFAKLQDYKEHLWSIESFDKDVLVCFDWGTLYNSDYHGGHVSVLDQVNLAKNEVRLIDPEYQGAKWKVVKVAKLKKAMEFHGKDKSGGFWEFTLTKRKREL